MVVFALFGLGVALAAAAWFGQDAAAAPRLGLTWGWGRWIVACAIAVGVGGVAFLKPTLDTKGIAHRLADAVRSPTPRGRALTAWLVFSIAFLYLATTAHLQDRDLFPKTHDEQSYALQARMIASGRLWMPTHPLADFFDTFYVIQKPAYASQYFIGPGLLFAPGLWLGLPAWVIPALASAGVVGLLYRVLAETIDGTAGLLSTIVVLSLGEFRTYSIVMMGHMPLLLLGLGMTWTLLRWLASARRHRWTLLIGILAGWAAITRPVDAICFALPIGLVMLVTIWRESRRTTSRADRAGTVHTGSGVPQPMPSPFEGVEEPSRGRGGTPRSPGSVAQTPGAPRSTAAPAACHSTLSLLKVVALLIAGAAPFLFLQALCNRGVTGRWLDSPFMLYANADMPGVGFHVGPPPAVSPVSTLPQKQLHYATFVRPYLDRHQDWPTLLGWWGRVYLPMTADAALPTRAAIALLPVGVAAMIWRRRERFTSILAAIAAVLPLFIAGVFSYTFFLEHYGLVVIPALAVPLVLGLRDVASATGPRFHRPVRLALTTGLISLCLTTLPEAGRLFGDKDAAPDETMPSPFMRAVRVTLPEAMPGRAIVLFRRGPRDSLFEEPVYNTSAAWPDDGEIICAHDLGVRNAELFRYYAQRDPERKVYLWDRGTGELNELGRVRDLASK